jgi:hypothetical protein
MILIQNAENNEIKLKYYFIFYSIRIYYFIFIILLSIISLLNKKKFYNFYLFIL